MVGILIIYFSKLLKNYNIKQNFTFLKVQEALFIVFSNSWLSGSGFFSQIVMTGEERIFLLRNTWFLSLGMKNSSRNFVLHLTYLIWIDLIYYCIFEDIFKIYQDRISFSGQSKASQKHCLADCWVVRTSQLGNNLSNI